MGFRSEYQFYPLLLFMYVKTCMLLLTVYFRPTLKAKFVGKAMCAGY